MLEVKDNTFFRFYFCRQDCYVSGRRQLLCYKEFRDSYKYCWDSFIDEILDGIRVARKWCKARKQIQWRNLLEYTADDQRDMGIISILDLWLIDS
jgi:hypothetical protein